VCGFYLRDGLVTDRGGAGGRRHWIPRGPGGLILVGAEQRPPRLRLVPLGVVRQQAQENVTAQAIRDPRMDRPDVQVNRLQTAPHALHVAGGLAGSHHLASIHTGHGHIRANHLAPHRDMPGNLILGDDATAFDNSGATRGVFPLSRNRRLRDPNCSGSVIRMSLELPPVFSGEGAMHGEKDTDILP